MNDTTAQQAALLKRLRQKRGETVAVPQGFLKEQKRIHREICRALREQPRTVPEVAGATNLPAHEVLWHITALRKYGQVVETGQAGDYYLYQTTKGTSA